MRERQSTVAPGLNVRQYIGNIFERYLVTKKSFKVFPCFTAVNMFYLEALCFNRRTQEPSLLLFSTSLWALERFILKL
jgi:hypothetical protein